EGGTRQRGARGQDLGGEVPAGVGPCGRGDAPGSLRPAQGADVPGRGGAGAPGGRGPRARGRPPPPRRPPPVRGARGGRGAPPPPAAGGRWKRGQGCGTDAAGGPSPRYVARPWISSPARVQLSASSNLSAPAGTGARETSSPAHEVGGGGRSWKL